MEMMVAAQSETPLRALRVQLNRRDSARRGGDYNEVPQAIQKKSACFGLKKHLSVQGVLLKPGNGKNELAFT
jgi:hypothetical protein